MATPLRSLLRSRRHTIFSHHTRIRPSIFQRGCSCTATLHQTGPKQSSAARVNPRAVSPGDTIALNAQITRTPTTPPRNHRDLAIAQGLFTTSPYTPGSPLLLPNGADMFLKLADFLRAQYAHFGFREVITPTIYKRSLWEKSGHWDNYAEDMFEVRGRGLSGQKEGMQVGEEEEFGLKPMNCPGHCLLFDSERRSYRDLPVRFADFSALHRNEVSGALSGLTRVRRFHQDDGHIFCMPEQIEEEIGRTIAFVRLVYTEVFNLGSFRFVLSTRPTDHYIGTSEEWESAESQLKTALDRAGIEWELNEGDGAFYGPKIDIILKDSVGKEHQTATIQLDFQLPQRFELTYQRPAAGDKEVLEAATPVMIHRAVLGSLERFMALLIEHYDGKYPFWIAPRPCLVTCVSTAEDQVAYARDVARILSGMPSAPTEAATARPITRPPVRVDEDFSARSLGKKLKEARKLGYNVVVTVGPREVTQKSVAFKITSSQHNPKRIEELLLSMLTKTDSGRLQQSGLQSQVAHDSEGNLECTGISPTAVRRFFDLLQDTYI